MRYSFIRFFYYQWWPFANLLLIMWRHKARQKGNTLENNLKKAIGKLRNEGRRLLRE